MPRPWVPWVATVVALVLLGGVAVGLYFLLRKRSACGPSILFPERAATAAVGVIVSNASGTSFDSVGFGPLPSTLAGPVFDAAGITTSGQAMLDTLVADPRVGCVYLQLATLPTLKPWLDTARFLLEHQVAVYVLIGMTVEEPCSTSTPSGACSSYQPLSKLAIQPAVAAVKALHKATGSTQHVGIAMDVEKVNPAPGTGWTALPALLPDRASSASCTGVPLMLFVGKNDVGKPGMEQAVAAVDTVGLMFYRSMVRSNLDSGGVNTKFTSDMATVTAEGHTMAAAAALAGTSVMAGVETTWEGDFRAVASAVSKAQTAKCKAGDAKACRAKTVAFWTKMECDELLEESFVLGGGIPPATGFTEFLAQASTQAAYPLLPAQPPTPTLRFFVEELRPMLQLEQNLKQAPAHWPARTTGDPSANKTASKAACVVYGYGAPSAPS